jgi:hypothetical protein
MRRLTCYEGDWLPGHGRCLPQKIPPGRCCVHADALAVDSSLDDPQEGYMLPIAMVTGRARAVVWPPWRMQRLKAQQTCGKLLATGASSAHPPTPRVQVADV